jgi:hypothetical protein
MRFPLESTAVQWVWVSQQALNTWKILGMARSIDLVKPYIAAVVLTSISGRLYYQDWQRLDKFFNRRNLYQKKKIDKPSLSAGSVSKKHRHVVIFGSAGSGKTTLLRYLAFCYCDRSYSQSEI